MTDYLTGENGDLLEENDEWVEGDSTEQEVIALLLVNKGELTEFPESGFGFERRIKQRYDVQNFLRELDIELDNDGFTNADIDISNGVENLKIYV
jgi:hypothetical protein